MKTLFVMVLACAMLLVGCNGAVPPTPMPQSTSTLEPTVTPGVMVPFGAGADPNLESLGEFLLPFPPVPNVPGFAPRLTSFEPATIAEPTHLNDAWERWEYTDQNDPSYTWQRRMDILVALRNAGYECGGETTPESFTFNVDESSQTTAKAVLWLRCARSSDAPQLFWENHYYFDIPVEVVAYRPATVWQGCHFDYCLTNEALGTANRIVYKIKANTTGPGAEAPIIPMELPLGRLSFVDYEFQLRYGRWRFTDLGGWSDTERWATIEYLMREAGFTERCEQAAEEDIVIPGAAQDPNRVWGGRVYGCYNQDGRRFIWIVDYHWERGTSNNWDNAQSVIHTIFAELPTEPVR